MATASSNGSTRIRFGLFEADLRTGELFRSGARVRLQEQPFQILSMLLERPGDVITRDELRDRLWPADTFVDFDHSLNAAIRRLRDALGDSAENPRFVGTVARRGYRFLAPVDSYGPVAPSPSNVVPHETVQEKKPLWHRLPWVIGVMGILVLGISIGFHVARNADTSRTVSKRRLTANPPDVPVRMNALSPNGRLLAFADPTGFYIRDVDSGETHSMQLPENFSLPNTTGYPFMPMGNSETTTASWFPDGTHLVFSWPIGEAQPPTLWQVSALGGLPRKLADQAQQPAVSPDGTQIAFLAGPEFNHELWVMQANGENRRKLLSFPASIVGTPTWSPDGRHIAVVRGLYSKETMDERTAINVIEVRSGNSVSVLSMARLGMCLAWTPDNRLIYSLQELSPNQDDSNLWAIQLTSGADRTVGNAIRLTNDPGIVASLSMSHDGKRLAYSKHTIQPDVYITELESNGTRLSSPKRLTLDERQDYPFGWTFDSKSVIFSSDRNGTFSIFRQSINSFEPELIIGGSEQAFSSRLTPDGSQLLYFVNPAPESWSGPVRLMRVPLSGGSPQLVYQAANVSNFQCARLPSTVCVLSKVEGDRLSFFYFDPVRGLGDKISRADLVNRSYKVNWSLSPDGRTLAISKQSTAPRQPGFQLVSLSRAGVSDRDITLQGWDRINFLDWAADGKSLWVTAARNGKSILLNVDLRGDIRPMLSESNMTLGWAIPSPDGRHLAIWKDSGSLNIWMLQNF
ncbi:MAG: LpqB family beta-propeller domain-containing protein [Acidobacteriaceae bacterium]